jgi:hypothetical protein
VKNNTQTIGLYACAENNGTIASGFSGHAEGDGNLSGDLPQNFTIPAGGTLVTVAGNQTGYFFAGDTVRIVPNLPVNSPALTGTLLTSAVFGGVNTTFSLTAPINAFATSGKIVRQNTTTVSPAFSRGLGSHAEGVLTKAIGEGSHAEGFGTQAIGVDSHAEGQFPIAYGDGCLWH